VSTSRPIELIFARNLLSRLSTPAFLVDAEGKVVYFNDSAGDLLGVPFEEAGRMPPEEWGTRFGPLGVDGRPLPVDELPLTIALRSGRPSHAHMKIRSDAGEEHDIEVSAFPILATGGESGAIAVFWPRSAG
jgi:PAS domain-containing protein